MVHSLERILITGLLEREGGGLAVLDVEEDDKAKTRAVIAVLDVEEDDKAETRAMIVSGKRGTGCSPDVMCCCTPPRHIRDLYKYFK